MLGLFQTVDASYHSKQLELVFIGRLVDDFVSCHMSGVMWKFKTKADHHFRNVPLPKEWDWGFFKNVRISQGDSILKSNSVTYLVISAADTDRQYEMALLPWCMTHDRWSKSLLQKSIVLQHIRCHSFLIPLSSCFFQLTSTLFRPQEFIPYDPTQDIIFPPELMVSYKLLFEITDLFVPLYT